MGRASSSGVSGRDADAQVDMIQLNLLKVHMRTEIDAYLSTVWQLESSLRELPSFLPVKIWI